jgi:hypothetical protein
MTFFVLLCFFVGLVTIFVICPIRVYKAIKNGGINIGTRRVDERGNDRDYDREYRRNDGRIDRTDGRTADRGRNIDKLDNGRGIDDLDNNDYSSDLGR